MTAMMEADVTAVCGIKGRHDQQRTATRHGHEAGSVCLGGRRVPVARPRMRATDGSGELPVATYELFSQTEVLGRMVMERMLAGLSTRRYPVGGGTGRCSCRADRGQHVEVGGVASVRRRDRDRPWPSCWPRSCPGWIW